MQDISWQAMRTAMPTGIAPLMSTAWSWLVCTGTLIFLAPQGSLLPLPPHPHSSHTGHSKPPLPALFHMHMQMSTHMHASISPLSSRSSAAWRCCTTGTPRANAALALTGCHGRVQRHGGTPCPAPAHCTPSAGSRREELRSGRTQGAAVQDGLLTCPVCKGHPAHGSGYTRQLQSLCALSR